MAFLFSRVLTIKLKIILYKYIHLNTVYLYKYATKSNHRVTHVKTHYIFMNL